MRIPKNIKLFAVARGDRMEIIMKINFLGDSITQGACASVYENNYVSLVGQLLGCEVANFGIGGTRIARKFGPDEYGEYFLLRAKRMADADLVFVFGGTNDYGHGDAPFGTFEDKTSDTYCGAVRELCEYLVARYGKEKITFILPIPRYNQENPYGDGTKAEPAPILAEYIAAQKKIVEEYGISVLDISDSFEIPNVNTPTELMEDGLHPNDKGHLVIAERIAEYVKSK